MAKVYHAIQQLPLFPTRVCKMCHIEKSLIDGFYRDRNTYRHECKQCANAIQSQKKREARLKNKPVQPQLPPGLKQCSLCKQVKPLDEFYRRSSRLSGYKSACKVCNDSRARPLNAGIGKRRVAREKIAKTGYKHCLSCHTDKKVSEFPRRGIGWNSMCKACYSKYYSEHRERAIFIALRRRRENPLPARELSRRRRARLRGVRVGRVSYTQVLEQHGYWCYICGQDIDPSIKYGLSALTFDHLVPISPRPGDPRGSHTNENLRPAHRVCNSRKNNRRFEDLTPFDRRGPAV